MICFCKNVSCGPRSLICSLSVTAHRDRDSKRQRQERNNYAGNLPQQHSNRFTKMSCAQEYSQGIAFEKLRIKSGSRKSGVGFKAGSGHDWNGHDCQNLQNRHFCLIVLYVFCRTSKRRVRCSPKLPKPWKPPKPSWRLPPETQPPWFSQ